MPSGILDARTGANVVLSGDHHYIHEGKAYAISGDTASIAAAGLEHIRFQTPPVSQGIIHMRPPRISSVGNSLSVALTENAVMGAGTAAIPRNRNRLKGDTSKAIVGTAATLTTAGSPVLFKASVATGGSTMLAGNVASDDEIILKPDTVYSITFTNTGTVTATVGTYYISWYSEDK